MAILENRGVVDKGIRRYAALYLSAARKLIAIILLLCSIYLLKFSFPESVENSINRAGNIVVSSTNKIYDKAAGLINYIYDNIVNFSQITAENHRLRKENEFLRNSLYKYNELLHENQKLKELMPVLQKEHGRSFIANVVSSSITPYNKKIVIDAGSNDGVKVNDVVRSHKALLGKIYAVDKNHSKAIIVGDTDFRIPVMAANDQLDYKEYGILVKQDEFLKIIYLNSPSQLQAGDDVYTSGDGTIFPGGIYIGKISLLDANGVYVKLEEEIDVRNPVLIAPSLQDRK